MGYLNHKYLYQGYSMDSLLQSAALRALRRLRALVITALFVPSFDTAMRRFSVSATDDAVCPAQTATAIG